MSSQTWTSNIIITTGTYDWSNASNWTPAAVPSSTDSVDFVPTTAGAFTVLAGDGNQESEAGTVTMDDPNLNLLIGRSGSGLVIENTLLMNAGTITLDGGGVEIGGGVDGLAGTLAINSGVIIGNGAVSNGGALLVLNADESAPGTIVFGGGTVIASSNTAGGGNTLEVLGTIVAGNFQIAGSAVLELDGVTDPQSLVTFTGGSGATAVLDDNLSDTPIGFISASLDLKINQMNVGSGSSELDSIAITGDSGATAAFVGSTLVVAKSDGDHDQFNLGTGFSSTVDNIGTTSVASSPSNLGSTSFFLDAVCFASGTRISTVDGERTVETLTAGDLVAVERDGQRSFQPVKWIGYRFIELTKHPRPQYIAPIRIARGAFAEDLPVRDLAVSPDHCLFLDGKLIPAKLLVNGMTIRQDREVNSLTYYHVEMERHSILFAEGVAAESYLDTGNRAFFSNAGLALLLHPEFHVNAGLRCWATDACAPLAVSPAAVLPVWRPLADRAVALGHVPTAHATTKEADIHLLADGRRIDTIAVKDGVHSFMVPAGVKTLALASRSVVPNLLTPYLDDPRQIGVAVRGITIRGLAGRTEFAADHPALAHGWHASERADEAIWRWTTGNATVPVGAVGGPLVVDVKVSETTTYLIEATKAENRLVA